MKIALSLHSDHIRRSCAYPHSANTSSVLTGSSSSQSASRPCAAPSTRRQDERQESHTGLTPLYVVIFSTQNASPFAVSSVCSPQETLPCRACCRAGRRAGRQTGGESGLVCRPDASGQEGNLVCTVSGPGDGAHRGSLWRPGAAAGRGVIGGNGGKAGDLPSVRPSSWALSSWALDGWRRSLMHPPTDRLTD